MCEKVSSMMTTSFRPENLGEKWCLFEDGEQG